MDEICYLELNDIVDICHGLKVTFSTDRTTKFNLVLAHQIQELHSYHCLIVNFISIYSFLNVYTSLDFSLKTW